MKKIGRRILIVAAILAVLFIAGPRTKIDSPIKAINLPSDLDRYLAESEAKYSDIKPGTEKTII